MSCGFVERDMVLCGNSYQRFREDSCFHSL